MTDTFTLLTHEFARHSRDRCGRRVKTKNSPSCVQRLGIKCAWCHWGLKKGVGHEAEVPGGSMGAQVHLLVGSPWKSHGPATCARRHLLPASSGWGPSTNRLREPAEGQGRPSTRGSLQAVAAPLLRDLGHAGTQLPQHALSLRLP